MTLLPEIFTVNTHTRAKVNWHEKMFTAIELVSVASFFDRRGRIGATHTIRHGCALGVQPPSTSNAADFKNTSCKTLGKTTRRLG